MLHIVVSCCGVCEARIPFEVKREALEEMREVKDSVAAPLEHLDLIVEPFHKAAVVPGQKVIGDFFLPLLQRVQKAVVTGQATGSHPPLPIREWGELPLFVN